MATVTANGKHSYDTKYEGKSLTEWVNLNHKENCRINGWSDSKLRAGAFGFDNIATSLVYFFKVYATGTTDDHSLCVAIHDGWVENYTYWRDTKPWLGAGKNMYFKSVKPIGDEQRNMCAANHFDDLPPDEQAKDQVFVSFMKKTLNPARTDLKAR